MSETAPKQERTVVDFYEDPESNESSVENGTREETSPEVPSEQFTVQEVAEPEIENKIADVKERLETHGSEGMPVERMAEKNESAEGKGSLELTQNEQSKLEEKLLRTVSGIPETKFGNAAQEKIEKGLYWEPMANEKARGRILNATVVGSAASLVSGIGAEAAGLSGASGLFGVAMPTLAAGAFGAGIAVLTLGGIGYFGAKAYHRLKEARHRKQYKQVYGKDLGAHFGNPFGGKN